MKKHHCHVFSLVLCLFTSMVGSASAGMFVPQQGESWNLYLGSLQADETPGRLENPSSNIAIGLASSYTPPGYPYLAFDVELWWLHTEYLNTLPTTQFPSNSNEMLMQTVSFSIGTRLQFPANAPFHFYLGGGYAYYQTDLGVYADTTTQTGYYQDSSETFAPYLSAGFNFLLNNQQSLEVYVRQWQPEGDFADLLIPTSEIGGLSIGLGFGVRW